MIVESLIEKSLKDLVSAITTDRTFGQLIFPQYRDKTTVRYSEQELKQIFLKNVQDDKNYFYSVETPTNLVYCFSDTETPKVKENHTGDDHYLSARFDVSLYNKDNKDELLSHIEFKYGNPNQKDAICKDFFKLVSELEFPNKKKNFFVSYLCVKEEKDWESKTLPSLFKKYLESVKDINGRCFENEKNKKEFLEKLSKNLSNVIVYLLCVFENSKSASTYNFSLEDLKNNYTVGTGYNDITDKTWLNEKKINTEN